MHLILKKLVGTMLCWGLVSGAFGKVFSLELNNGWLFQDARSGTWWPARVPGTVHTDLLENKLIPDAFYRDNEAKVQWVSTMDWTYSTTFSVTETQRKCRHLDLVFEGLDTYADVFLNGKKILQADNMFRTWKVPVKQELRAGANKLSIHFYSAKRMVDSLAQAALPLVLPSDNNRQYARKAQYNFGWDWAPKLITSGIWRPVHLVGYDVQLQDSESWKRSLHKVDLIQERDSIGRSFYFTIDGKPVFMKGANWVPADVFLPRVTKAKYRTLLYAAKEANFNMLRVWGGGVYEDDAFYDLCDSLGIFVWQDFMFAGAMYPSDSSFIERVRQEVADNMLRLRRHKCIVAWCGNNEIDEAWHNWGWQAQFHLSPQDSARLWHGYLHLFRDVLPAMVKQYDGTRPYIASSPLHGWGRKESMTRGDSHYWGVWWGIEPIATYREKVPRFMSEYGMQAMPNWESIIRFSTARDWDTASVVMRMHQKHPTGYKTLAAYLSQNNYQAKSFKAFVSATQQLQSKALATAIDAHMAAAPYCMGTLFWQFNDCWPVTSWSIIDYYGNKKKAFYTVKKLYGRPVSYKYPQGR